MARVTLSHVRKVYRGDITAVEGLDLTIEHGSFACILGPSGSGKSTILKVIAGIEETTSGRILFDDEDVTNVLPERRDIAMVFQSYALYPTMNVFDNIAFPLRLRNVGRQEVHRRVEETAALLGIRGLLKRRPRELSGGERQRVALGRAIVRDPKVFLLDEPLSNLDANLRMQMRQELKHLQDLLGATFIYVTHDQDDALAMGDRVAVIAHQGRLEQYAETAQVYDAPASRFVASFIGRPPMNLFRGVISTTEGRLEFRNANLSLPLPEGSLDADGHDAFLGIRPEAISVCPLGETGADLAGAVYDVAVVQPNVYVTVHIGAEVLLARLPHGIPWPRAGETIALEVDPEGLHLFDAATGRRLGEGSGGWPAPVAEPLCP